MTISEFIERYPLHNSIVLDVMYDDDGKAAILMVDYCYYVQDDYHDGDKPNGIAMITFYNASLDKPTRAVHEDEILSCVLSPDGELEFLLMDYVSDCWTMKIKASDACFTAINL